MLYRRGRLHSSASYHIGHTLTMLVIRTVFFAISTASHCETAIPCERATDLSRQSLSLWPFFPAGTNPIGRPN